jgi:hypothetical protein
MNIDWESRYAATTSLFGTIPSDLLLAEQQRLHPGLSALALADGEGRNGVWLAEQGLRVTSVDISATAQQRARLLAQQRGVSIETLCLDLLHWSWPVARFDIITSIFMPLPAALRLQLHTSMWQAVKPGGLVLIEGYHVDHIKLDCGGPNDPDMLLSETLLQQDFPQADILRLERVATQVEMNGDYLGEGVAMHFVARRPE